MDRYYCFRCKAEIRNDKDIYSGLLTKQVYNIPYAEKVSITNKGEPICFECIILYIHEAEIKEVI